jgi:hypothetical protein
LLEKLFASNGRLLLRLDAVFDFILGLLLLTATWSDLYDTLDLPQAEPEMFTQLAGGLLVAYAYLLWMAPLNRFFATQMSLATGAANAVGVVLLAIWLSSGDLEVGDLGGILLNVVSAILAVLAALQLGLYRRLTSLGEDG